jgi:hypothetical protein
MNRPFISTNLVSSGCIEVSQGSGYELFFYGIEKFMEAFWKRVDYRCSGSGAFSYTFNGPDGPQFERYQDSWNGVTNGSVPQKMSNFVCSKNTTIFSFKGASQFTQDDLTKSRDVFIALHMYYPSPKKIGTSQSLKDDVFFFQDSYFGNDVVTTHPLPPIDGSPIQYINAGQLSFEEQVYPLYLTPNWYVEVPSFFVDPPFSKPLIENFQIESPFNMTIVKTEEENFPE